MEKMSRRSQLRFLRGSQECCGSGSCLTQHGLDGLCSVQAIGATGVWRGSAVFEQRLGCFFLYTKNTQPRETHRFVSCFFWWGSWLSSKLLGPPISWFVFFCWWVGEKNSTIIFVEAKLDGVGSWGECGKWVNAEEYLAEYFPIWQMIV